MGFGAWVSPVTAGLGALLFWPAVAIPLDASGWLPAARLARALAFVGEGRLPEALDSLAEGHAARYRGTSHWRDAARAYARARELGHELGVRSIEVAAHIGTADLSLRKGKSAVADMLLDQAEQLAKPAGLGLYLDRIARLRAELVLGDDAAPVTANA